MKLVFAFLVPLITLSYGLSNEIEAGRPQSGAEDIIFSGEKSGHTFSSVCVNDTEIVDAIILRNDSQYNKHKVPKTFGMRVDIQVWVQDVSSISEITQDFEIDLYMNEVWQDPRLHYEDMHPCKLNVSLDHHIYDEIWTPNTCFINSKMASIHESPFRNIFLMIYPNGTLWTNYRVKLTGPCSMHLENFPMDIQQCFLTFESFNYNTEEVKMRWFLDTPISIMKEHGIIELPDFTLVNATTSRVQVLYPAGYWDELTMTFTFERRYGWYILQAYIPTYLTIFISWISFYLGVKSIPARTMLGVNALLAMTFQFGSILRNLPRVSYVKAIDVWMLAGMTFVFASLLELAVIGYLSGNQERDEARSRAANAGKSSRTLSPREPWICHDIPSPPNTRSSSLDRYTNRRTKMQPQSATTTAIHCATLERESAEKTWSCSIACTCWSCKGWTPERIDTISAVLFPVCFTLFNVCYWGYYSSRKLVQ